MRARPCDVSWIRSIKDQCEGAGVPVFVKQLGRHVVCENGSWGSGTANAWGDGPDLIDRKGGDPEEWPEDLRVREMPR